MGSGPFSMLLMVRSIDSTTSECSYCSFTPSRRPRVSPYAMNENRVTFALAASVGSGLRGFSMDTTVSVAPTAAATCAGSVCDSADSGSAHRVSAALAAATRTGRQRRNRMEILRAEVVRGTYRGERSPAWSFGNPGRCRFRGARGRGVLHDSNHSLRRQPTQPRRIGDDHRLLDSTTDRRVRTHHGSLRGTRSRVPIGIRPDGVGVVRCRRRPPCGHAMPHGRTRPSW